MAKIALSTQQCIEKFAEDLGRTKALRQGSFVFRLTGEGGGTYCLAIREAGVAVTRGEPVGPTVVEVTGSAESVVAILQRRKDAMVELRAGGYTARGDLSYLTEAALELGLLTEPEVVSVQGYVQSVRIFPKVACAWIGPRRDDVDMVQVLRVAGDSDEVWHTRRDMLHALVAAMHGRQRVKVTKSPASAERPDSNLLRTVTIDRWIDPPPDGDPATDER